MEDKSSFTATDSADTAGLLHSVCTMASPVEGVDGKCLLYSLLSDKTESTYVFMLNVLKSLLCDIECGIIMLDFEKASMNAFTQVFDQFSLMTVSFTYVKVFSVVFRSQSR